MANTSEELIKQMYESQLNAQKEQLQNDYNAAVSNLDAQKQQNQKVTDANLNRTAVEGQKAAASDAEYYAAAGLTSGAKAQARMARENQMLSDLTAIRAAQQTADAEAERQRGLLAKEYDNAIRKAQAENDLQKAQALYEEAERKDAQLLQQQQNAAAMLGAAGDFSLHGTAYGMTADQIAALKAEFDRQSAEQAAAKAEAQRQQKQAEQAAMAEILAAMGDYSGFANLYGITPEQVDAMQKDYNNAQEQQRQAEELAKAEAAAKLMAQSGDFSRYGALYGLTDAEVNLLNALYAAENETKPVPPGETQGDTGNGALLGSLTGALIQNPTAPTQPTTPETPLFQNSTDFSNESLTTEQIKQMQNYFGVEADGMWGNQSATAAGGRTAQQAWDYYQQLVNNKPAQPGKLTKPGRDISKQSATVQNLIRSLESTDGMKVDKNEVPSTIIEYAMKNRITMDEAEYMLKYFGYDPEDFIE